MFNDAVIPALPLATWLANRNLTDLAELLYRRRERLAGYRVTDFHSLADLLENPWALAGALPSLPLPALQVIEAHAALGRSVTIDALAGFLTVSGSPEQHRANVLGVLDLLTADALAWSADGVHSDLAKGFEQLIPSPLGLGPSGEMLLARMNVETMRATLRELGLPRAGDRARLLAALRGFYLDAGGIRGQVAAAPSAIRGELEAEAAGTRVTPTGYAHSRRGLEREVESWGMARAMLYRDLNYRVVMPSQVRLALRGNDFRAPFDPAPGEIPTRTTSVAQVTGEAGTAALEFVAATTMVLGSLARQPVQALKDGGLGVREIRKLAKATRVSEAQVTLVLALAREIGLVSERTSRVGVSELYPTWNRTEPNVRLAQLVMAWWRLGYLPTLPPKVEAPTGATIMTSVHHRDERALRQATTRAFVDSGEGQSVTDLAALAARITWSHPILVAGRAAAIPTIVAEAPQLGVTGGTGCSPMAFALVSAEEPDLAAAAGATLPATTTTATFGSDLTVLVSGSPTAHVTTLFDACADRESSGSASLWRFSPASVRRAFDEGSSAAGLLSSLGDIAGGPLPQPLEYLITDVGRRHGVVTVTAGLCVLHSRDDPALLQQICSDRSLKQLGLQLIAPMVALSQQNSDTTLTALRRAGYLPSDASGPAVITTSPSPPRNDLPSDELDLDELAKEFGVDIERLLGPIFGGPAKREGNEKSARQRARAIAKTLHAVRPGTR